MGAVGSRGRCRRTWGLQAHVDAAAELQVGERLAGCRVVGVWNANCAICRLLDCSSGSATEWLCDLDVQHHWLIQCSVAWLVGCWRKSATELEANCLGLSLATVSSKYPCTVPERVLHQSQAGFNCDIYKNLWSCSVLPLRVFFAKAAHVVESKIVQ